MPGPLLLLEEHVYDEACVLETAVMLSEISIIALAGFKEILSVHHFTVLVILPMRYAPALSSFSQFPINQSINQVYYFSSTLHARFHN